MSADSDHGNGDCTRRSAVSFELDPFEPVPRAVRRTAEKQLESALEQVGRAGRPSRENGKAVHEARKKIKKLRSLLKLLRPKLGESAYRSPNERLRRVG